MKHLNKIFVIVIMLMSFNSHAQDNNNPWALSFGVNAVDTKTSAGGGKNLLNSTFSNAFMVNKNWNILPSVSYLGLSRYIGDDFSIGIQGSINKISKYVNFNPLAADHDSRGYVVTNPGDLMYYGIDVNVKYSFMNMIKSKIIDPSVHFGGGYTFLGQNSFGTVNPGLGLTFWMNENIGFSLESTYKKSFGDRNIALTNEPNAPTHFQHTAGLTFKFGGKDTDGDGIYDKDDACPEVAGLKQFNGCPDTDGDGIIDGSDSCPEVAGLAALNGCPDKDGDGIADKDDSCPDVAGLAAFQGCPDTDGDGVTDASDKCPKVKGPKENAGCPWTDKDGDSVLDKDDKCPEVKGTVANNGCPEVTEEVMKSLQEFAKTILFDTGKSSFQPSTIAVLDNVSSIMKEYTTAKFSVEGHTDNVGKADFNQKLSEVRAAAVVDYLVKSGIDAGRISSVGYGSSKPIADNKTKEGKANNRRTEIILVK